MTSNVAGRGGTQLLSWHKSLLTAGADMTGPGPGCLAGDTNCSFLVKKMAIKPSGDEPLN